MIDRARHHTIRLLRWSEKYTKTDMVYLASGGLWLLIGQFGALALSFASAIAFGHLATQDTYGNYRYAIVLAGLLGTFTLSGIGIGITQSIARGYEGALSQGFWLNLRWSSGIVILSFAAALYYFIFDHNTFLAAALCLIGILYPLIGSYSLFDSVFTAKKQFKRGTLYGIANSALPIAALIVTLFITRRAIVLVAVYLIASLTADAICYFLAERELHNANKDPGLFAYSAHLSVMSIINAVADKVDSIAVFSVLGPTQLAVYAYAIAMPEQIKQILKTVAPLSIARFAERSIAEIRVSIWRRVWALILFVFIAVALYIIIVPWLFHWLFPIYNGSIEYSRWYALSILLSAVSIPFVAVFQAHKKTKDLYITSNGSSLVLIILLPVLTYFYGIGGAIASQFIYRGVTTALVLWRFAILKD